NLETKLGEPHTVPIEAGFDPQFVQRRHQCIVRRAGATDLRSLHSQSSSHVREGPLESSLRFRVNKSNPEMFAGKIPERSVRLGCSLKIEGILLLQPDPHGP